MLFVVLMSALLGLGAALPVFVANFDCSQSEGEVWWGCGSYGLCHKGQYEQIDCVNGTVYNREVHQCTHPGIAPPPCGGSGTPPNCRAYMDNPGYRIADLRPDTFEKRPPCTFYYTCSYGAFMGYQACPPNTIYDEGEQRCAEIDTVPKPCGLAPPREEDNVFPGQGLPVPLPVPHRSFNVNPYTGKRNGVFGGSNKRENPWQGFRQRHRL